MPRVYLGLGSNIDRERNLRSAVAALQARFDELRLSTVYESEAVGFKGDAFYNLVASFRTTLPPAALEAELDALEAAHGRRSWVKRAGPRSLDLDLLLYGDVVIDQPGLRLPRPDILRYPFVLGPLAELAPSVRHPEDGRSFSELWATLRPSGPSLRPVALDLP